MAAARMAVISAARADRSISAGDGSSMGITMVPGYATAYHRGFERPKGMATQGKRVDAVRVTKCVFADANLIPEAFRRRCRNPDKAARLASNALAWLDCVAKRGSRRQIDWIVNDRCGVA